jgi:putative tricarboxylic transport membrane protein
MIGMFALPAVIEFMRDKREMSMSAQLTMGQALRGAREAIGMLGRLWRVLLKSSVIGTVIGAIPGTGSAIAAVLSYRYAERTSRDRTVSFGQGNPEGIAAPEAANSAITGGALIPMLVLGIPGDPITAVMLGALVIHGLTPGVALFQENPQVVYGLFASFGVALVALAVISVCGIPLFIKTMAVPLRFLMAAIVLLSVVGAYTIGNSLLDVWIMLASGVFAYYFRRWGYPILPLLLALILGKILEEQFRMSLIIALGDPLIFLMKPLSLSFVGVFVAFLSWRLWQELKTRRSAEPRGPVNLTN